MSSTARTSRPTHFPFLLLLALQMLLCATTHAQRDSPSPPPPGYEFRANFNPSMAVIIVVILSAFFCMAFFALYVRRCGDDDHVTAGGAGGMTRQAKKGLDKAVVESFPTMVYSEVKGLKIGKEGTLECAVCLCEFDDDETLRLLPKCSHAFHPECIDMWLDSHTTCPVCRANLAVPGGSDPNGLSALGVAAEEDQELGNRSQEEATVPPEHVLIAVEEEVAAPAVPGRSRSARVAPMRRLPMWTEEEKERFTLRLPEGVTKEVMGKKRLDRSATMAFPVAEGRGRGGEDSSVCRGYRVGGGRSFKREWAARSDRWAFLARTLSLTKAHKGSAAGGKGESSGEASAVGNLDRV